MPDDDSGQDGDVFIAVPRDFCGFQQWLSFPLREVDMHAGATGPLVVYLKALPPPGSAQFPIGTMIVKTVEIGDPSTWEVHAMVKRGGDFNARGAIDWEFFDLGIDADCTPLMHWRGEHAPRNHGYKSLPGLEREGSTTMNADCNSCHGSAEARSNDFVLGEPFQLSDLS